MDIIYGKKEEEDEEEGYMSYAKKSKIRNQKFFEEYEKKQKLLEEEKKKEREVEEEKLARSPGFAKRGTVRNLLHGPGSVLKQLESKEIEFEQDKSNNNRKILDLRTIKPILKKKEDKKEKIKMLL